MANTILIEYIATVQAYVLPMILTDL